jgi:hypothetical protein
MSQNQFTHLRARIISGFIYMYCVIVKEEGKRHLIPQKLETVLKKVEEISNDVNRQLIKEHHKYLISKILAQLSER